MLPWAHKTGKDRSNRDIRLGLMTHDVTEFCASCQSQRSAERIIRINMWVRVQGMLDTVLEVSWTADQRHLVAAGGDQALRMWEIDSGRVRHTLTGHTGKVLAHLSGNTCLLAAVAAAVVAVAFAVAVAVVKQHMDCPLPSADLVILRLFPHKPLSTPLALIMIRRISWT